MFNKNTTAITATLVERQFLVIGILLFAFGLVFAVFRFFNRCGQSILTSNYSPSRNWNNLISATCPYGYVIYTFFSLIAQSKLMTEMSTICLHTTANRNLRHRLGCTCADTCSNQRCSQSYRRDEYTTCNCCSNSSNLQKP